MSRDYREGRGWDEFRARNYIREMIDRRWIRSPEEYGFDSERDMMDFIQGRGDYRDNNDFTPSYREHDERNGEMPRVAWSDVEQYFVED